MTTSFRLLRRPLGLALLLTLPFAALAQGPGVGIGTTTPNPSAALDVSSTTKGLLPPRMTIAQRDAINPAATAAGLTIYNTSTGVLNTWNGTKWIDAVTNVPGPPAPNTFSYTGSPQTYTVPAGVTALTVDMAGAASGLQVGRSSGQGLGGRVRATLPVTSGQVFTIRVGGAGATGVGGYNGGGGALSNMGGGGGASDLRTGGTALPNRVLVAGGGGGSGAYSTSVGGAGGGLTGGTGSPGLSGDGGPGAGGSQTAAGAGGTPDNNGNYPGSSGNADTGGAGTRLSGGGGGGYFGGGSGGEWAGGGGGSSYTDPGASAVQHTQGYQNGNGYVTITPNVSASTAPALDASNFINMPWTKAGDQVYPTVLTSSVGIGTASPNSRLSISPGTAEPKLTLYDGGSSTAHYGLGVSSNQLNYHVPATSDRHVFYAGGKNGDGTELLRIQGNGSVGIGTDSPGTARLYVAAADNSTGPIATFQPLNPTQGVSLTYQGIAKTGTSATSDLTLDGKSTGNILLHTNGSTGSVGIGTASPTQKLDVVGNATVSGNVGIGTGGAAPRGVLDVAGTGNSYLVTNVSNGNGQSLFLPGHLWLAPFVGTSGTAYVQARVPGPSAATNIGLTFRTTNAGALVDALVINPNGSASFAGPVTATNFSPSDVRLKENIRPLTGALAAVQGLRGVRYSYRRNLPGKTLPGGEQVGVLAQEVEKIFPELVSTGADGYKAVNYAQLTPVLIEAIKELKAENDALKARAATSEANAAATTEAFEARLRALEAGGGQARK